MSSKRDALTGDLFDIQASRDAKASGMAMVDANANPDWKAVMLQSVTAVAMAMQFFTADDVFELAAAHGHKVDTHDRRAFGPVMMRAAKSSICKKANRMPVNSRRASLHSSPITVWESLIFKGVQTDA